MKRTVVRIVTLLCAITLLFPLPALAATKAVPSNRAVINYIGRQAGISFSTRAALVFVRSGATKSLRVNRSDSAPAPTTLAVQDIGADGLVRTTLVAPYDETDDGMVQMDAQDYLAELQGAVAGQQSPQTLNVPKGAKATKLGSLLSTNATSTPSVRTSDLVIYLNYYYTSVSGYSLGLSGYLVRPVQVYATITESSANVTGFVARVDADGDKYTLSPLTMVDRTYSYTSSLTVSTMVDGTQYSKSLPSISPAYVYTGSGAVAPDHRLSWGGTYKSKAFSGTVSNLH